MARQAGNKPYIVARKGPKIYMSDLVTVNVDSITTDHMQTLCVGHDEREVMEDKQILVVDDVISTGESIAALDKLVDEVGGNVVGRMSVLAEGEAANRDDIIFLAKLPLFDVNGEVM